MAETVERETRLCCVGDEHAEIVMACSVCGEAQEPGDEGILCGHPHCGRKDGKPIKRRFICIACSDAVLDAYSEAAQLVVEAITKIKRR